MLPGDLGVSGQRGHAGYLKGDKEEKAGLWYGMQYSLLHCTPIAICAHVQNNASNGMVYRGFIAGELLCRNSTLTLHSSSRVQISRQCSRTITCKSPVR